MNFDNVSRRHVILSALATVPITVIGGAAHAAGSLCAMTRMNPGAAPGIISGSKAAKKDVRDVLAGLGMESLKIPVYASRQVQNAAAFANLGGRGPAIVYNPEFMSRLYDINDWAPASVIAHEIGHHVAKRRADPNSHVRELAADEVSGCAMAWMQATEDQALVAMTKGLPITPGSPTHPGTAERVAAIRRAYRNCKSRM